MFKSPEQVVYRAIASTPETARLLGLRVYPVVAPATAGMPFAIYRRSAIQRQQTLSGPRGVPQVSMDLTVFATRTARLGKPLTHCVGIWMGGEAWLTIQRSKTCPWSRSQTTS